MSQNELVRAQFNLQAERFATWNTTVNEEYNRRFFSFCGIKPEDNVLDVACGSGAFSIFCAKQAKKVCGVDISDAMIGLARRQAEAEKLGNTEFICHRVEELPVADSGYSVVLSKAAFHHFPDPVAVFEEMKRCCKPGGRICIQDIVAYPDVAVDSYFENLEKAIDRCHYKTWPKSDFLGMFEGQGIVAPRAVEVSLLLGVEDYISHACQDEKARAVVDALLMDGLNDPEIAKFFSNQDGKMSFKRNVLLVRGERAV